MHPERVASLATRDRQHRRHWRRRPSILERSRGTDADLTLGWGDQYRVLDTETQPPATLNGPVFGPIDRPWFARIALVSGRPSASVAADPRMARPGDCPMICPLIMPLAGGIAT